MTRGRVLHNVNRLFPAVAAGLLALCACTSNAPTAGTTPPPSVPVTSVPAAATPTPELTGGNIEIAPTGNAAGPFRITPLFCGKLSSSQQNQFGTTARGGFVYRYTNTSPVITGSPDLSVNFLSGATVAGSNVTGDQTAIGPGQNSEAEVDALNGSGGDISFTRCEVVSYTVVSSQGDLPGTFAP